MLHPFKTDVTAPGQMGHVGGRFFVANLRSTAILRAVVAIVRAGMRHPAPTHPSSCVRFVFLLLISFILFCVIRFAGGNLPVWDVLLLLLLLLLFFSSNE